MSKKELIYFGKRNKNRSWNRGRTSFLLVWRMVNIVANTRCIHRTRLRICNCSSGNARGTEQQKRVQGYREKSRDISTCRSSASSRQCIRRRLTRPRFCHLFLSCKRVVKHFGNGRKDELANTKCVEKSG